MTKGIPHHLRDFDLEGFTAYLADQGALLQPPTNPYEVIRYHGTTTTEQVPGARVTRKSTHVVYRKADGRLTYTGWSNKHYRDFQRGRSLGDPALSKPRRKRSMAERRTDRVVELLRRDGGDCWFCGLALGEDITLEHLIPKSAEGGNGRHNLVLAHKACNNMAANKPLAEKIELRAELTRKAQNGDYEP